MFKNGTKQSTLSLVLGAMSILLSIILIFLSLKVMNSFDDMIVAEESWNSDN